MSNQEKPDDGRDGDSTIRQLIDLLEEKKKIFIEEKDLDSKLSGKDRQRLISARVKNYGFIAKAFDIAEKNPEFMPVNLDRDDLWEKMRDFEDLRQLGLVLQQFQQLAIDSYMQQADVCYRESLYIYGSLRQQAKAKLPGALPLYESLMSFFHRRRRIEGDFTQAELDQDLNQLNSEQ